MMGKKAWVSPKMDVQLFEANEYVAACEWKVSDELSANCGTETVYIKLEESMGGYAQTVWSATSVDATGQTAGGTGILYPIQDNMYAFFAGIYLGHTTTTSQGEYYPLIASGSTANKVGDPYGSATLCACEPHGQTGAVIAGYHHHLTNVKSKNNS